MFKMTVQYKDFNDQPASTDLYFHISKAELLKLAADDTVVERMKAVSEAKNKVALIKEMESVIRLGLGVRSQDGLSFIKDKATQDLLIGSPAYDELLVKFLTEENAFVEFVKQLLPAEMQKELLAAVQKNAETPETAEAVDVFNATPAWIREDRDPTEAELRSMTREQMQEAFSRKLGK